MPKIKLSALVSDMKGKSQGSVFSTNAGGTYFRNNPSGGGRKTAAWAQQKNSFAILASSWKALTIEQQEAWTAIAPSYPTTNAFGDQRIPSGYELFMRLNGTLKALNQPTLVTPEAPGSFPSIDDVEWQAPDNYMYFPQRLFNYVVDQNHSFWVMKNNFLVDADMTTLGGIFTRFVVDSSLWNTTTEATFYSVVQLSTEYNYGVFSWIERLNNLEARIYVVRNVQDSNDDFRGQVLSYIVDSRDLFPSFLFGTSGSYIVGDDCPIHVGFNTYLPDSATWYSQIVNDPRNIRYLTNIVQRPVLFADYSDVNADLFIGRDVFGFGPIGLLSDFRLFTDAVPSFGCSGGDILPPGVHCHQGVQSINFVDPVTGANVNNLNYALLLLSYNYVLGFELGLYGFDKLTDGVFYNYGSSESLPSIFVSTDPECQTAEDCTDGGYWNASEVECDGGVCIYAGDLAPQFVPTSLTVSPLVIMREVESPVSGFMLVIESTLPISAGRNINQTRYKRIGFYELTTPNLLLSGWLLQVFGGIPNNSNLALRVSVVDLTTGQAYDTQLGIKKPPKKITRFKAGSELSGKVN